MDLTAGHVTQALRRMGPVAALKCFTDAGLLGSVTSGIELTDDQKVAVLNALLPPEWMERGSGYTNMRDPTSTWVTPEGHLFLQCHLDRHNRRLNIRVRKV